MVEHLRERVRSEDHDEGRGRNHLGGPLPVPEPDQFRHSWADVRTARYRFGCTGQCLPRAGGGGKYTIIRTTIRIADLNTWFTQDDPYRAAWEACGSNFSGCTCSKIDDFGGIAAHELGHTLAVGHANAVVNGNKRGCGTAIEPTMCSMARPHRSEWRTLETHDRDTLHKHVDLNR